MPSQRMNFRLSSHLQIAAAALRDKGLLGYVGLSITRSSTYVVAEADGRSTKGYARDAPAATSHAEVAFKVQVLSEFKHRSEA